MEVTGIPEGQKDESPQLTEPERKNPVREKVGIRVNIITSTGMRVSKGALIPAMIRKVYLAKCLNEGNRDAMRKDINLRPVEGVNGNNSNEEILEKLAKFGITPEAVTLWGTGKPLREFLWSEEMADASVHVLLLQRYL